MPTDYSERKPLAASSFKISSADIERQWEAGAAPREPAASALLADVDVQEQACLMAMFEARWSTSQEASSLVAAAACRAGLLPLAVKSQASSKRRISGSPAVPTLPAEGLPPGKGKRQRTLLGFFSFLGQ